MIELLAGWAQTVLPQLSQERGGTGIIGQDTKRMQRVFGTHGQHCAERIGVNPDTSELSE